MNNKSVPARWNWAVCVTSLWLVAAGAAEEVVFKSIGSFPEVRFSRVFGMSADGSTLVGDGLRGDSVREAYRWTPGEGLVGLGLLPSGTFSIAKAVTPNSEMIVGVSDGNWGMRAVRWTPQNGIESIGEPPPAWDTVSAGGVSANGKVIVGQIGVPGVRFRGFVWSTEDGFEVLDEPNSSSSFLQASAVSADGRLVVGVGRYHNVGQPVAWTKETGIFGLGLLPDAVYGTASAMTGDGSVVVGNCIYSLTPPLPEEAFRWTAARGMEALGDLPGGMLHSYAADVSADGSIIVGAGNTDLGDEAFIWDAGHGMRNLRDVLVHDFGLDLTGWRLSGGAAISDDGLTIAGNGVNPDGYQEGWVVYLPEPTAMVLLALVWAVGRGRARRGVCP
jgi:uncharacterized membrane protein